MKLEWGKSLMSSCTGLKRKLASVAVLVFSVASGIAHAASDWTVIDIGTLGGPGSHGAAVNNRGVVVGCADVATGGTHAFAYRNGVMHDLGTGAGAATGNSCALAVNDRDVIAGRSATRELVVWKGSSLVRLGVQGDIGGINDAGTVAGTYVEGSANRAFLFRDGALIPLGTLGGDGSDANASSSAAAINQRNQVVGSSNGRAFLYENGAMRDLGTLGGNSASARDINERGQVVGMSSNAFGQPTPFIYDGTMRELPGPSYSGAIAINNRGQVVGSGEGTYGYLIDGGTMTRLGSLPAVVEKGWRRLEPTGINDRGWIVGTAIDRDDNMRAFLLIPPNDEPPAASKPLRVLPGSAVPSASGRAP
jgi:probable HAF family extracellular repeat protein